MPAMYVIEHPLPHSMPPGLLDTVPVPPAPVVDDAPLCDDPPPPDDVGGSRLNLASTLSDALPTTRHELVPEQSPLHPANFAPLVADANSVTTVPAAYVTLQPLPQLMP